MSMSTENEQIFEKLAAPFLPEELKTRRQDGREMHYITARTARRRLNEVLGPQHWECRIEPAEHWVKCVLTITMPDGKTVTREAMGGYPKMPSEEDKVKGGDTDAFKRCCVTFGIAEYLYGDDHVPPERTEEARPRPSVAARPVPPRGETNRGAGTGVSRDGGTTITRCRRMVGPCTLGVARMRILRVSPRARSSSWWISQVRAGFGVRP